MIQVLNYICSVITYDRQIDFEIFFSGWIIVSSTDGTVKMYSCKKNYDTGQILVTLLYSLWAEADRIWSGNVKVKTHLDKSIVILSKENCVLIFHLETEIRVITHEFEKRVAGATILDSNL